MAYAEVCLFTESEDSLHADTLDLAAAAAAATAAAASTLLEFQSTSCKTCSSYKCNQQHLQHQLQHWLQRWLQQ